MIKKILLSLGLIGFGIINFTEGAIYGNGTIGEQSTSTINNDYNIEITYQYDFLTSFLGTNKRVLSFTNGQVFYRGLDGKLHFAGKSFDYDGIVDYFVLCDSLSGLSYNGDLRNKNCIRYNYNENIDILNNLFYNIRTQDTFIYSYANAYNIAYVSLHGVDIPSLNKLLIFPVGICLTDHCSFSLVPPFYSDSLIGPLEGIHTATGNNNTIFSLYGFTGVVMGAGKDFSSINNNEIGVSPVFIGGNSDISNIPISGDYSSITGGYTYMNCTNQNVLAYYIRTFGYNGSMCNVISGGVAEGYYPYGTLLEFCNIIYIFNNEDLSYYNKPYTGHNKNIVCNSPGAYFTGDDPVSIDWSNEFSGIINGSGEYENQSSRSFLINLSDILKGNFYIPESGDFGLGYLPRYIILGFMGVIFFNFIRK